MARLRMVEVLVPAERGREAWDLLQSTPNVECWRLGAQDETSVLKAVVEASGTEAVLDTLEARFGATEGFRVMVQPVDAILPRLPEPEERAAADAPVEEPADELDGAPSSTGAATVAAGARTPHVSAGPDATARVASGAAQVASAADVVPVPPATDGDAAARPAKVSSRISRQEMYEDISAAAEVSRDYLAMVALSTVVASVGLLRDSVALVIGAMVLAPLLGPNVALALATCLGDGKLGKRAVRANLIGVLLALGFAVVLGALVEGGVMSPEPGLGAGELLARTEPRPSDIVLALAAGCAGALAFTGGVSATLIGVMVAVALLPPLVSFGVLLGAGQAGAAWGALVLLVTNVACVNLAAIGVFLARGIRPRTWWEGKQAVKATRWALAWWSLLLAVLAVAIVRLLEEG